MNRARYLLSNINLMNIILTVALICFINYMLLPFLNRGIQYSLPVIVKHEKPDSGVDNKAEQIKTPSPLDYAILSEQNLFHPERKIPVEVKEAQPLPKPDFVLYGTLISGDMNIAYMEDMKSPYSTPGREKRQTPLKQGDSMSGFMLKEVKKDQVVMRRGEEKIVVSLNDAKARESAAPAGTREAAATQTPGQPAQAQQKPPSLVPGQQIKQEKLSASPTSSEKTGHKSPSSWTSPNTSPSSGRKPRKSGGGLFGNSFSQ